MSGPYSAQGAASAALIVIDQEPLRQNARQELRQLHSRLARARGQITEFETVDRPAFSRWLRSEFAEELKAISSLEERAAQAEALVSEVQMIRFAVGCSYHQAYVNAMERRRLGLGFEGWSGFSFADEEAGGAGEGVDGADASGAHRQEGSKRRTRSRRGAKEGDRSDHGREKDEGGAGHRQGAGDSTGEDAAEGRHEAEAGQGTGFANGSGLGGRIKRVYRELARMLHPDLRAGDARDSWLNELWHRTQQSYKDGDSAEMESLLVLCRVTLGGREDDVSVWDMKSALGLLKRTLSGLRRQLSELRHDLAWGFSSLKDRGRLRRRIAYDLDYEHEALSMRLESLEAQLARWSVPRRTSGEKSRRRSRVANELEFDL